LFVVVVVVVVVVLCTTRHWNTGFIYVKFGG